MDQMWGHIICQEMSPKRVIKLPAKSFSWQFCLPAKTLPANLFPNYFLFAGKGFLSFLCFPDGCLLADSVCTYIAIYVQSCIMHEYP
jgi:hypothetical protein